MYILSNCLLLNNVFPDDDSPKYVHSILSRFRGIEQFSCTGSPIFAAVIRGVSVIFSAAANIDIAIQVNSLSVTSSNQLLEQIYPVCTICIQSDGSTPACSFLHLSEANLRRSVQCQY